MTDGRRDGEKRSGPGRVKLAVWKKAVFSLVVLVAFFALLEGLLALLGVRPLVETEDPFVGFAGSIPLFVPSQERLEQLETSPAKLRFFNRQAFRARKEPGTFRIFCVGGSTTYGRPYGDATSFCGWLRALLPVADPSRRWEVINAGGISYASYRVALVVEEVARYEPDLVVVYSGHNEFLERRTYGDLLESPRGFLGLRALFARTRTFAALVRMLGLDAPGGPSRTSSETIAESSSRTILPAEVKTLLDESVGPSAYTRNDAERERALEHFRINLRRISDLVEAAGARILFVTPASNLRDCAPFKSEHDAAITPEDRARWQERMSAARAQVAAGAHEEALEELDAAARIDPRRADLHFLRGRTLERLGRYDEARESFERALEEDVCPLRALAATVDAVRSIARERDAPLVDFAAQVAARSPQGIPGAGLFLDHVHPTIEGHRLLALAIIEKLASLGLADLAPDWGDETVRRITDEIEGSLDREAHGVALRNLAKVLGWAGKFEEARALAERAAALVPEDAEARFYQAITLERTGQRDAARVAMREALRLNPGFYEAHDKLGRYLEEDGDREAAEKAYREALRIAPGYARAHANLGNLLSRTGDLEGAERHLREAVRLEPDVAEVHQKLGVVLLKRGNDAGAEAALRKALEIDPGYARAALNLGFLEERRNHLELAEHHYREAIRMDPEYVPARLNLSNLLVRSGRIAGALNELERVLELSPGDPSAMQKLVLIEGPLGRRLQAGQRDAETLYLLGFVRSLRGDTAGARELLEAAHAASDATPALRAAIGERLRKR